MLRNAGESDGNISKNICCVELVLTCSLATCEVPGDAEFESPAVCVSSRLIHFDIAGVDCVAFATVQTCLAEPCETPALSRTASKRDKLGGRISQLTLVSVRIDWFPTFQLRFASLMFLGTAGREIFCVYASMIKSNWNIETTPRSRNRFAQMLHRWRACMSNHPNVGRDIPE